MVNSSSRTAAGESDIVAMASLDAVADVAVTTALMVACQKEDADQVKQLLSLDKKVRLNSTDTHVIVLLLESALFTLLHTLV